MSPVPVQGHGQMSPCPPWDGVSRPLKGTGDPYRVSADTPLFPPQAVCCPDHIHCCPQGYTCDPQGGTCLQGGVRLPWLKKSPALWGRGGDVRCDDRTSCPDGSTCCKLSGGTWGCCPLEQVGAGGGQRG